MAGGSPEDTSAVRWSSEITHATRRSADGCYTSARHVEQHSRLQVVRVALASVRADANRSISKNSTGVKILLKITLSSL